MHLPLLLLAAAAMGPPPRRREFPEPEPEPDPEARPTPKPGDIIPAFMEGPNGERFNGEVRVVSITETGDLSVELVDGEASPLRDLVRQLEGSNGKRGFSASGRMSPLPEAMLPEKLRDAQRALRDLSESTIPRPLPDHGMLPPSLEAVQRHHPTASTSYDLHRHREAGLAEKRKRERKARKAGRKARKR